LSSLPDGRFVLTVESYDQYPEVAVVSNGEARAITSLAHAGADYWKSTGGKIEAVSWPVRDGLEIHGFLVTPDGPPPYPLIVHVHGGPVFAYRQSWSYLRLARFMVKRGYACLFPNPRGSSGRGQEFARMVYGDMYGEDTHDILAGVDAMVERGIADPARLGVTGGSYGGLMSSWLITQTDRFAAAVPVAPVTNNYSQHWTSNIPDFDRLFLQDDPSRPGGKYFERSPIMFAGQVKTPTLLIAGRRDRCTPPGQAVEFHHALLEHGVESVLVLYPEEGHGVRSYPAYIDYVTRVLDWFLQHMPARSPEAERAAERETVPAASSA
jgi:dipeptidyl aminopeptidase/acylaminoacyl peptidase